MNKFLLLALILFQGCGYYSFVGKNIPEHIKTVQIVLFEDSSGRYDLDLSTSITTKIEDELKRYNIVKIENSAETDGRINGKITVFQDQTQSQTSNEYADAKTLTLTINVSFFDNINENYIIANRAITDKIDFNESQYQENKDELHEELIQRVAEKAVLTLISNW